MRLRHPLTLVLIATSACYLKYLQFRIRRRRKMFPPRCGILRRVRLVRAMWRHTGIPAQIRLARVQFVATDGREGIVRELSAERT